MILVKPSQANHLSHDSDIEGLKRLATAMKKNGAKALVQIHHGGAQALPELTLMEMLWHQVPFQ